MSRIDDALILSGRKPLTLPTPLADIKAERVEWLWRNRIPRKAVTVLAGMGGLGKSQLSLAIAAEATRGELTPDPLNVLVLTAEDPLAAVVRPRAELAGANLERLFVVEDDIIELPNDAARLRWYVEKYNVGVLILDPLQAFIGAETNSHKDADIRRNVLRPLRDLAEQTNTAILPIMHFKKGDESDVLYRVSGSVGFGNAARSALAVVRDPLGQDPDARVLAHIKSNFGREQPALRFRIEGAGDAGLSRVVFGSEDPLLTQEALFPRGRPGPAPTKRDEATQFIREVLAGGPVKAREIMDEAAEADISWDTIKQAKRRLGVESEQERDGWVWRLPG